MQAALAAAARRASTSPRACASSSPPSSLWRRSASPLIARGRWLEPGVAGVGAPAAAQAAAQAAWRGGAVAAASTMARKSKKKVYAVLRGRRPGKYLTWAECEQQVKGFPGAQFKGFADHAQADAYLGASPARQPASALGAAISAAVALNDSVEQSGAGAAAGRPSDSAAAAVPTKQFRTGKVLTGAIVPVGGSSKRKHAAIEKSSSGSSSSSSSSSSSLIAGPAAKRAALSSSSSSGDSIPVAAAGQRSRRKTLVVYTDGSCLGNANVARTSPPAGWGFCALEAAEGDPFGKNIAAATVVHEGFGAVVTSSEHAEFLGADAPSNNTGELSAIAHALRFVGTLSDAGVSRVVIRYDSQYAAKSVMGIFNGAKNRALIEKSRGMLKAVKAAGVDVVFDHVKGHSDDKYNDRADTLANQGAAKSKLLPLHLRQATR